MSLFFHNPFGLKKQLSASFAVSIDKDQTALSMQPDFESTVSNTIVKMRLRQIKNRWRNYNFLVV